MNTTTTAITFGTPALKYYSGYAALDCPPSPAGTWNGTTFTAADGSAWVRDSDDDTDPRVDGSGVHFLLPAPPAIVHYEEGNSPLLIITAHRVTVQGCPAPTAQQSAIIRALVAGKWVKKTHIHASHSGRGVSGITEGNADAANAIWFLLFGSSRLYPETAQKAKATLAPFFEA